MYKYYIEINHAAGLARVIMDDDLELGSAGSGWEKVEEFNTREEAEARLKEMIEDSRCILLLGDVAADEFQLVEHCLGDGSYSQYRPFTVIGEYYTIEEAECALFKAKNRTTMQKLLDAYEKFQGVDELFVDEDKLDRLAEGMAKYLLHIRDGGNYAFSYVSGIGYNSDKVMFEAPDYEWLSSIDGFRWVAKNC